MDKQAAKAAILSGETALGIEFGSTRIKAVLVDKQHTPLASGSFDWENRLEDGIWTYHYQEIWDGLQACYADLTKDVERLYGVPLTKIGAMGVSAMMHGYMPFDENGDLLVPFRTWRNTITGQAAAALTDLFSLQHPSALEHCALVPGHFERRSASAPHCLLNNAGRMCALEAHRAKGRRRWGSQRYVPHRFANG